MIPRMPSSEVGGRRTEPVSRGAESGARSLGLRLAMSRPVSWTLILLIVAPCRRAGDLASTTTPENVSESSLPDAFTEKYQPSSKSFVAEWSFAKPLWRNVNSTVPQMREGAATWSDPDSGVWWLFGGHRNAINSKIYRANKDSIMKKKRPEKNSFKYSTTLKPLQKVTTKYFSDLWHYQPSERLWTRVYPSTSSLIPAPGGPDHLLTRPILCGGGGSKPEKSVTYEKRKTNQGESTQKMGNDTLAEDSVQKSRGDGRIMAVYAPGSKPVDTVWLLEMNDTRLWTTYVCCDDDTSTAEKSDKMTGERGEAITESGKVQGNHSIEETSIEQKNAASDEQNISRNSAIEEGPPTFCPDFHTLTRPPITWCDKKSQALFALDITNFKKGSDDKNLAYRDSFNTSSNQDKANNTQTFRKINKTMSWIPRLWRFDLRLTQWDHVSIENLTMLSTLRRCGKDTSSMHWTSLSKCLILICPAIGSPSYVLNTFSLCMEDGEPKFETLGTIQLSQGASQTRRWAISAVESTVTERKYLLLAYGRLLDLWVLEKGSSQWSPLENIWQGAALKWFRSNSGLYHLQIIEEGLGDDKKQNEEEEEETEELEEGRALGIAHVGEIGLPSRGKMQGKGNLHLKSQKIQSNSKERDGVMEVFMVNPRDGSDVSLREQGLFIIRISEDNGTIFGHKTEIHQVDTSNTSEIGKEPETTTMPSISTEEVLNTSTTADLKNDSVISRALSTDQMVMTMQTTPSPPVKGDEGDPGAYDQNPGDGEDDDDEWSAELVLETNGSSPVLNASLLALVENENHDETTGKLTADLNQDTPQKVDESSTSTHDSTTTNDISAEIQPLMVESDIDNLDPDQTENIQVVRPLSIAENDVERGGIALGAFGSDEGNGYQGTILFFAVSFSMLMLLIAMVFLRRCVIVNCHFASHHLPHRCRSNSSVLLKEPPPIRYSVIPDEVCYAGLNSAPIPAPGSPMPPSSILSRPLTT
ncbi:uncharacterized protein LOC124154591 [Ischnura elegans]|uniref:uncharacterized protein LOC124154591 n=1 Tax=Ischnura elegans TaxID=197161 RepID=UPI001ED8AAEA|nr:uncharacterized protein LOC124154591 [Ischnura elegans]